MASPPFKVKAIYEYTSEHDDDLKFPIGQIINVTEEEGDDWYVGDYTDALGGKHDGLFPRNFVEKYEPEVPSRPTRSARPRSMVQPLPSAPATAPEPEAEKEDVPLVPAASKPQAQSGDILEPSRRDEDVQSPPSATSQHALKTQAPPSAPKAAPAESAATSTQAKAAPPPVAPKSNAFKDRIAAFNKAEAAPIAPLGPKAPRNDYIKKPFVAPPPSRSAYVPPVQKVGPVHKPYIREEDPEIRQREEEDRAAAEAAGLTGDSQVPAAEQDEDTPKPMSLKERMALLQREQEAARNRHAAEGPKKKPPVKKNSESSERSIPPPVPAQEVDDEGELERVPTQRQSLDINKERPRIPSSQRRAAEPMSPLPAAPEHEILSGGEEADQSGAGELTEDDTGTIGPRDEDERHSTAATRAPSAPAREPDIDDEEDTADDGEEEEEELDEEEQRKQRLRERMARLAGGQQGGGPFNPFGVPPAGPPAKKRSTKEKRLEDDLSTPPPQVPQMVAIPGMGGAMPRMQSPEGEGIEKPSRSSIAPRDLEQDNENEEPPPPPRRSMTMDKGEAPPLPQGKALPVSVLRQRQSLETLSQAAADLCPRALKTMSSLLRRNVDLKENRCCESQAIPACQLT